MHVSSVALEGVGGGGGGVEREGEGKGEYCSMSSIYLLFILRDIVLVEFWS